MGTVLCAVAIWQTVLAVIAAVTALASAAALPVTPWWTAQKSATKVCMGAVPPSAALSAVTMTPSSTAAGGLLYILRAPHHQRSSQQHTVKVLGGVSLG